MSYSFLLGKREKQLDIEKEIDTRLREVHSHCPDEVTTYLFSIRRLNRTLSEKLSKSSFYSMPRLYSENLETMDKIQNMVVEDLPYPISCTCSNLAKVNKTLRNMLRYGQSLEEQNPDP